MKIAYIISNPIKIESGVGKKILEQISIWRKFNMEVKLFAVVKSYPEQFYNNSSVFFLKSNPYKSRFMISLIKEVINFNPDIIYWRYDLYSFNYEFLSKRYKIVVETQTKDIEEFRLTLLNSDRFRFIGKIAYFYFYIFRNRFLNKARAFIHVTEELNDYYSIFNKPSICIPNGIDLSKYNVTKKADNYGKIKLFFIGTEGMPWHGVDIIEKLAERIPEYEFHIVGIKGNSKLDNLKYYGPMGYDDYIKILERCHICIATLALHRKNMKEASPLKTREYLAHGFPVIMGYNDTSFFGKKVDFILELDFSSEIVTDKHVDLIKDFVLKNKKRIVNKKEIENLDIYYTEQKRIKFLKDVY